MAEVNLSNRYLPESNSIYYNLCLSHIAVYKWAYYHVIIRYGTEGCELKIRIRINIEHVKVKSNVLN